jgi:hypothetical protein
MTGCLDPKTSLPAGAIQETIHALVPALSSLLTRITNVEATVSQSEEFGVRLASPLTFPDGIGEGAAVAELFRYRDKVRLDIHVEHNRFFALADGGPSERRCFLNDYVASVTIDVGATTVPTEFVRNVVSGVAAARDAVRRHNSRAQAPWNEIRVSALVAEVVA